MKVVANWAGWVTGQNGSVEFSGIFVHFFWIKTADALKYVFKSYIAPIIISLFKLSALGGMYENSL